jgi:3-hydroxyisobutyrate dehydrogenase
VPALRRGAVGFIGVGTIGAPMAAHLADWPDGLVVCDVRAEATQPFADKGATVVSTPADMARQAEVISVMVLDDAQVREVVSGPSGILGAAERGTVVAIHSTIRPETAAELAAVAAAQGIHVVDAPVSGGFVGAHAGKLAVMIGGSDEAVARCRDPFGRWAALVLHVGPIGAGTKMKLARNLLQFCTYAAVGEAQRLAEAAGVSLQDMAAVVRHSDALTGGPTAIMLRDTAAPMAADDPLFGSMDHARVLGDKDLALALELGAQLGVDLPVATVSRQRLGAALGVEP